MNIELIIKTLTILGSILGSIAFFQNMTKEVASTNKDKWKDLSKIISVIDLDNLKHAILSRRIDSSLVGKLDMINYHIRENNVDIIGFKSILTNKIHRKLNEFREKYLSLLEFVQVPYWNPYVDADDNNKMGIGYAFDKSIFFNNHGKKWTDEDFRRADEDYRNHIEGVMGIVDEMKRVFSDIQKLANRESYELLMPWKWNIK